MRGQRPATNATAAPGDPRALALLATLVVIAGSGGPAAADPAPPPGPKPLQPQQTVKAAEGYFDDVFALDTAGARVAVIRTDGATFAKLETIDAATAKTTSSVDLPGKSPAFERLELAPDGKGVVVITREGTEEAPVFVASLLDAAGKAVAKVGPAHAFGRPASGPAAAGKPGEPVLVAYDQRAGAGGALTYTVTPYRLATLTPAGKPRVYQAAPDGTVKAPPFKLIGFHDGYTRALGERPGAYDKKNDVRAPARAAILDALTGKVTELGPIEDVLGWAGLARLRMEHPDRSMFAVLNQDDSGVDVVDPMGKKLPAQLVIPFRLYDPKSLQQQEGPEPGAFHFSLAVDPLNPDAVKHKRPDMPMLDVYAADAAKGTSKLRGRVFTPRPVAWRVGAGRLVVLKRFKSFTRGGDELQIYDLR